MEPALHTWNKPSLVMVYVLYMLLNSICQYFVKYFSNDKRRRGELRWGPLPEQWVKLSCLKFLVSEPHPIRSAVPQSQQGWIKQRWRHRTRGQTKVFPAGPFQRNKEMNKVQSVVCSQGMCQPQEAGTVFHAARGDPIKQTLFINICVFIPTCLNFHHLQSTLHLMQYTYGNIFPLLKTVLNSLILMPFSVSAIFYFAFSTSAKHFPLRIFFI